MLTIIGIKEIKYSIPLKKYYEVYDGFYKRRTHADDVAIHVVEVFPRQTQLKHRHLEGSTVGLDDVICATLAGTY